MDIAPGVHQAQNFIIRQFNISRGLALGTPRFLGVSWQGCQSRITAHHVIKTFQQGNGDRLCWSRGSTFGLGARHMIDFVSPLRERVCHFLIQVLAIVELFKRVWMGNLWRIINGNGGHLAIGLTLKVREILIVRVLKMIDLLASLAELSPGLISGLLISALVSWRRGSTVPRLEGFGFWTAGDVLCRVRLVTVALLAAVPTAVKAKLKVESSSTVC